MVRVALFAVAALGACGRIGFDDQAGAGDGGATADTGGSSAGRDASGGDTNGSTASFGTMEVGISIQNTSADRVWISRFELTEPGMVQTLVAHVGPASQASTLRGIIYADASGTPTTLLATTNEVALSASGAAGWLALPLASPVALAPGMYWLGTHNSTQLSINYRSSVGATKFGNDIYGDGTDATYGGGGTTFSMELSIHAEYTR